MPTLEVHSEASPLLRLWHYPAHENPFTWAVVAAQRGHLVRRSLDIEVNPPGALGQLVFEAEIPHKVFATIMGELQRVSVCPVSSSQLVLDAGHFGVEIDRYPDPVRLAWTGAAPVGWEALSAWHWRTIRSLNKLLPRTAHLPYEHQTGTQLNFDED